MATVAEFAQCSLSPIDLRLILRLSTFMKSTLAGLLLLLVPCLAYANDSLILYQSTAGSNDEASDMFGRALAVGDFDGDGFADLAIGVPNEDQDGITNTGMVVVFYGGQVGLDRGRFEKFTQNSVAGAANEDFDQLGYTLAAGDLDGDGFDDLAVGLPFEVLDSTLDDVMVVIM
jgi:hypothetical protein